MNATRPAILIVVGMVLTASTPLKPAWQWTLDERLAARFDDAARNRRVEAFEAQRALSQAQTSNRAPRSAGTVRRPADVIYGHEHPELLLPFEIMTSFTQAAYGSDAKTSQVVRQDAWSKALALGLPAEFPVVFEKEAEHFISLQRQEMKLKQLIFSGATRQPKTEMERLRQLEAEECAARARTIHNLHTKFGTAFDKFLYSAIAPGVWREFFDRGDAQQLRAQEEGCK